MDRPIKTVSGLNQETGMHRYKHIGRINRVRNFALEEAAKLASKGHHITPSEIEAMEDLAKIAHYMCECEEHHYEMKEDGLHHDGDGYTSHMAEPTAYGPHGGWGDSDPEARKHFELLEKHYMGFWRASAEYKKTGSSEAKTMMIDHMRHQLAAHDAIATFVMHNCPAACPEIKQVIMEWKAKKASM